MNIHAPIHVPRARPAVPAPLSWTGVTPVGTAVPRMARGAVLVLAFLSACVLGGCGGPRPPGPPERQEAPPDPGEVEAVLLVVGDAGEARPGRTPVLTAMGRDARRWTGEGAAVAALFLGDNVYPGGVRTPAHPDHPQDTLALHAQMAVIMEGGGPLPNARAVFVPGNHDWGGAGGAEGRGWLAGLHREVGRWQEAGIPVHVLPDSGTGPAMSHPTDRHRVIFLDTQAWLHAGDSARARAGNRVRDAVSGAGDRTVLVMAHHPLRSGSWHGSSPPLLHPRGLASRLGLLDQDLSHGGYARMARTLQEAMEAGGGVLLYAAGHDHNVQLFRDVGPVAWHTIVGSGSRLSPVWNEEGMVLGVQEPGYARIHLLRDGGVHLELLAADDIPLVCPPVDGAVAESGGDPGADGGSGSASCSREGADAFRTVFSRRIKPWRPPAL